MKFHLYILSLIFISAISCHRNIHHANKHIYLHKKQFKEIIDKSCYVFSKDNFAIIKYDKGTMLFVNEGDIIGKERIIINDIISAPTACIINGKSNINDHIYSVSIPKCSNLKKGKKGPGVKLNDL